MHILAPGTGYTGQQTGIAAQGLALGRELGSQSPGKGFEALHQGKRAVADRDVVIRLVQTVPGQVQQAQPGKGIVQGLSLAQPADIVETGVVVQPATAVALQAAAHVALFLQHQHAAPRLRQEKGALQSAQSGSYDRHIIFHHAPHSPFSSI